jgi:hypothetical protein
MHDVVCQDFPNVLEELPQKLYWLPHNQRISLNHEFARKYCIAKKNPHCETEKRIGNMIALVNLGITVGIVVRDQQSANANDFMRLWTIVP